MANLNEQQEPITPTPTPLHFEVSSGLKSVLGSELITSDEVALFELVKNSFDARASRVDMFFDIDTIVVADNGTGMSFDDIQNKWLVVAYSTKRAQNQAHGFRDEIADRKHYAGSKGIGRFSSDRLGKFIILQTRRSGSASDPVHAVRVDWDKFDLNHQTRFQTIPVEYTKKTTGFSLPAALPPITHGTALTIEEPRRRWDRDAILRLKSALAKLINPFGAESDGFKIVIHAPAEMAEDERLRAAAKEPDDLSANALVNSEVGNFIFSTLQEKTTFIEVSIDPDGTHVNSALTDRGELIYRVREPCEYKLLAGSGFQCKLFFLNQSAKLTFAKRMGVPSVQFGSVFLFRNGFRVFPIGEEGNDWYGMDRRKQQGYARFLGTRDVIGRIDVSGREEDFKEASSRDTGLIETGAVKQLRQFFQEYGIRRLERYVVPVTFVDKEDKNTGDVSRLLTDPGRARVAEAVAKLVDNKNVELLDYSKRLIGLLDERSAQFEGSLSSLRAIAEKTQDKTLYENIEEAERRFTTLKRSEETAKLQADHERTAKEAAESRAAAAELLVSRTSMKLEEEKKRNLFLTSIATLDTQTILNLHHQVTMYAVDINQQIENFIVDAAGKSKVDSAGVLTLLERLTLLNRKILGVTKFATKANFRLESERITADLGEYVRQYIEGVAKEFLFVPMSAAVATDGKGFTQTFKPIDVSVVIDNLIANAKKAGANRVTFDISHPNRDAVHILVKDNGRGFGKTIDDLERVFEKGFTSTDGSGLGLYHVRMVLGEMSGTIQARRRTDAVGAEFLIRLSK